TRRARCLSVGRFAKSVGAFAQACSVLESAFPGQGLGPFWHARTAWIAALLRFRCDVVESRVGTAWSMAGVARTRVLRIRPRCRSYHVSVARRPYVGLGRS